MRFPAFLTAVIILLLFLCGCGNYVPELADDTDEPSATHSENTDDSGEKQPVQGGTLRLSVSEIGTINPLLTQNADMQNYGWLVCEPLVNINAFMEAEPCILESFISTPSYNVWEFKVKENILFHDGSRVTAAAVKNLIDFIIEKGGGFSENVANVAGCFATDESTVQFVLKEGDANFPGKLYIPLVGPATLVADLPTKLVGTGIFRQTEYDGNCITLEKNTDYRDEDKLTHFDRVEISIFKTEYEKMTSDCDICLYYGETVSAEALSEGDTIYYFEGSDYNYVAVNCSSTCLFGSGTGEESSYIAISNPLENVNFRKALTHLVSAQQALVSAGNSRGVIALFPLHSGTAYYRPEHYEYDYNISLAKSLVESCGYSYDGENDTWLCADGTELFITAISPASDFELKEILRQVTEGLEKIGVTVILEELDDEEYERRLETKEYMLAALQTELGTWMSTEKIFGTGETLNYSYYSSSKADVLLDQIRLTADSETLLAARKELEDIIIDEVPIIGFYISQNAAVVSERLKGISSDSFEFVNLFAHINEWWLCE